MALHRTHQPHRHVMPLNSLQHSEIDRRPKADGVPSSTWHALIAKHESNGKASFDQAAVNAAWQHITDIQLTNVKLSANVEANADTARGAQSTGEHDGAGGAYHLGETVWPLFEH